MCPTCPHLLGVTELGTELVTAANDEIPMTNDKRILMFTGWLRQCESASKCSSEKTPRAACMLSVISQTVNQSS